MITYYHHVPQQLDCLLIVQFIGLERFPTYSIPLQIGISHYLANWQLQGEIHTAGQWFTLVQELSPGCRALFALL